MRRLALVLTICLLGSMPAFAQGSKPSFTTDQPRYLPGHQHIVTVTLTNDSEDAVTMGEVWEVVDAEGNQESFYLWPDEELTLEPGEQRTWKWEQNTGCYGLCQNIRYGDPVGPGSYAWVATLGDEEIRAEFQVGRYFRLGFRYEPDYSFTVFVPSKPVIQEMRAQLDKPKKKRMIVAGIVNDGAEYNPVWSYTMRPDSIFLGEVFIEVCDANPSYVEENRDEWMGQQWCPWSSYVRAKGRG